ncbi:pantoate--beta-alanine ligase [bacterium]|nr:pantoate--beta-alanine ligase [candidate division CSSED10-310 bacterium]
MEIIRSIREYRGHIGSIRSNRPGVSIGFVPTMGYLHEGHLSLIDRARRENDLVVVSLFVNPKQFAQNEDFDSYPRDENKDIELCRMRQVDILFIPGEPEMYEPSHLTVVHVKSITEIMCGGFRPGHFDGVTTVVGKLFHIVQPNRAYFGQKDGQQTCVIQRMTRDLNFDIEIIVCPTVREPNGLAMSSRNAYLSPEGREKAAAIYRSLQEADRSFRKGESNVDRLIRIVHRELSRVPGIKIQYIECRNTISLKEISVIRHPALLAVAVFLESVRLIDNVILTPKESESS